MEDAFKMKRKTLKNNLKSYDWAIIEEVLINHKLSTLIRAEQIPLELYIEIANLLKGKK